MVELHGGGIAPVGQHPGQVTAQFAPQAQGRGHELLANALPLVARGNADLVDPQLWGGFIRVQIVHRRHKANNPVAVTRYYQMVAIIR